MHLSMRVYVCRPTTLLGVAAIITATIAPTQISSTGKKRPVPGDFYGIQKESINYQNSLYINLQVYDMEYYHNDCSKLFN